MQEREIIKYAGLLGIVLAVLLPIAGMAGFKAEITWLIAVLGLITGFFLKADVKTLLAGIVLLSITGIFATIPQFGELLTNIFKNLAVFAGAMIAIPAIRVIWSKFKVRF